MNEWSLESENEKIRDSTFDDWKNIRGPRSPEDPDSLKDKIQQSLRLRNLTVLIISFSFIINKLSTGVPTPYSCPVGREFHTCRSLEVSSLMADNLDKKLYIGSNTSICK